MFMYKSKPTKCYHSQIDLSRRDSLLNGGFVIVFSGTQVGVFQKGGERKRRQGRKKGGGGGAGNN